MRKIAFLALLTSSLATPAAADTLREALRQAPEGRLQIGDKSEPDDIYRRLGMSKKVFKKALGALYRRGEVQLFPEYTQLVGKGIKGRSC